MFTFHIDNSCSSLLPVSYFPQHSSPGLLSKAINGEGVVSEKVNKALVAVVQRSKANDPVATAACYCRLSSARVTLNQIALSEYDQSLKLELLINQSHTLLAFPLVAELDALGRKADPFERNKALTSVVMNRG